MTEKIEEIFKVIKDKKILNGRTLEEIPYNLLIILYEKIYAKELIHSEIIADFLNPNGNHKCGNHFLREFFNVIGMIDEFNKISDFSTVKIYTERGIENQRRIDILVEWVINKEKQAIIIENKLHNASNQLNQLTDYCSSLEKENYTIQKVVYTPLDPYKKPESGDYSKVKIVLVNELIQWLETCKKLKFDSSIETFHNIEVYIGLLKHMNNKYKNNLIAMDILNLNDDDLQIILKLSNVVKNDLSRARTEKIIASLKHTKIFDSSLKWKEKQDSSLYIELYYEPYNFWLEIWIKEDSYDLYLVRYATISNNCDLKTLNGFTSNPEYYKNLLYYKHEQSFKFPSIDTFKDLIEVLVSNLKKLKEQSEILKSE